MADEQDLQMVVASDQLALVGNAIGGFLDGAPPADDRRLGLTLVTFDGADALRAAGEDLITKRQAALGNVDVPGNRSDLDIVLGELRLLYEHRYAGWKPTMGKNRTLNGVQFKPYTHSYDEPTVPPHGTGFADAGAVAPGTRRVPVGLFDTRLDAKRELAGAFVARDDALLQPVPDGYSREWWEGHATFIAGIIHNAAPSAVLDVRTALRPPVEGQPDTGWTMSLWEFAKRLAEFDDAGIAVLNLSLGVSTDDGRPPLVLERAIARLTSDMVVVAAAGNHGSAEVTPAEREEIGMPQLRNAPLFPAALDDVLAVGAVDAKGRRAAFNPRGDGEGETTAPWIDVWARGVEVTSLYLGSAESPEDVRVEDADRKVKHVDFTGWANWSGTSFAAAEITAAVAERLAGGMSQAEATEDVRAKYGSAGA